MKVLPEYTNLADINNLQFNPIVLQLVGIKTFSSHISLLMMFITKIKTFYGAPAGMKPHVSSFCRSKLIKFNLINLIFLFCFTIMIHYNWNGGWGGTAVKCRFILMQV